jgi:hypothetical protein
MHNSYVVGAGAGATLEANLAEPQDIRGNENHGNSIRVTNSENKAFMVNGADGNASSTGVGTHNAGENVVVRSSGGTPKSFISKGDDLVTYKGIPTTAQVLEQMGVLSLNSQGRYDFNEEAPAPPPQETPAPSNDPHESFAMSDQENAEINSLIPESVQGASLTAIANRGIEAAVSGDFSSVISSFSKSSGQTPDEARVTVGKAIESYTNASNRYLEGTVGMQKADIPAFYSWAQQNAPSELRGAISKMVNANSFRDLGKLVGTWAAANPPSTEALQNAGYKMGKATNGDPTVFISGFGEISVKSAARAKLI